ncbi:MAG: glucokinase [Methylococcales bacterium]|nr:glucokinase [Methylococcales bacterium]
MILAGDIGGTKTTLALYTKNSQGILQNKFNQTYISANYPQFNDILSKFIQPDMVIDSVCIGIAGPIVNQRCQTTNLPWVIDSQELSKILGTHQVKLLNDLEAMAVGMLHTSADDLVELNPNAQHQDGNIAVIAAGTGLGEAILYWDGKHHHPIATEGGHTDFAPQTEQQDQFLLFLRNQINGHVSWERVLSGDGFGYLYDFLVTSNFSQPCSAIENISPTVDRNALISQLGINNKDPVCAEVVRLFVELYAAEAGNLALKCLSTGGVFIGGGIGSKIRSALEAGEFMYHFSDKGRFQQLLNKISIKLSLNPNIPLIGAANYFSDN